LIQKLEAISAKIVKSQYAKSVKAWIYLGRTTRLEYEKVQERAIEKLGRNIPTYHIFDVLNALKDVSVGNTPTTESLNIEIHPIHNRCPWQNIKNLYNESAGFRDGHHFWEFGEKLRLQGNIAEAISLFDKARENGYDAPVLYESYEKAYRKIKDYENEIAILMERYERNQAIYGNDRAWTGFFVELKEKIELSKKRLIQLRNKGK
jgi:tetratricopeptide (TPR) repeat protein